MNSPKYFGTDGIRGTAGQPPMTVDFARKLGWAAGKALSAEHKNPLVLIGRDTRFSGPGLQAALETGLTAAGARVASLGVFPTPGVAFVTHASEAIAGVVISASHNPAAENGIKFITSDGMKLSESTELAIEALLDQAPEFCNPQLEPSAEDAALRQIYIDDLLSENAGLDLRGLKILLDPSNGANYLVGPQILKTLGAELIVDKNHPDGKNINDHAGSEYVRSYPHDFAARVRLLAADLGIAFDGDADRVILFSEQGQLVDGDQILVILAGYLHEKGRLLGNTLVTTNMANGSLKKYAEAAGFRFVETPVGDKHVSEQLMLLHAKTGAEDKIGVGGEQSGHIILLDDMHRTGDGLRTALWTLRILLEKPGQRFSQLVSKLEKYPQLIASAYVASKPDLKTLAKVSAALEAIKTELPGLVRMNARYSGTEPKFRLMLETDTRHNSQEIADLAWKICRLLQDETATPEGAKIEILNVAEGGIMSPQLNLK